MISTHAVISHLILVIPHGAALLNKDQNILQTFIMNFWEGILLWYGSMETFHIET